MKKTLLKALPENVPREIRRFASGAAVYDSSCSTEARVFFIKQGYGYYLKCADRGMLEKEYRMTGYFHTKGLGAEVLSYYMDECDWLLTTAVVGEDGKHKKYLENPERLCATFAYGLRKLHETDYTDCPVMNRTADYLAFAETNYRKGKYDESQFPSEAGFRSAKEAYDVLEKEKDALKSRVLIHGDYCLPNMILNDWKISGFIDVGFGGVGDRHIDLFWGVWTLWSNLKTNRYYDRFLDAYGRDKADESVLRIIAAAESFG